MEGLVVIIIVGVVILVLVVVVWAQSTADEINAWQRTLQASVEKFKESTGFEESGAVVPFKSNGFAIDKTQQKLLLVCWADGEFSFREKPVGDLISTEIVEDGDTVTRTSRSSQAGGAIVGGLAFGGVGAVVGGLTGKTISSDLARRVELRLVIDDPSYPSHVVTLMNDEAGTQKNTAVYQQVMKTARYAQDLLTVLIKRSKDVTQPMLRPPSVADELEKLAILRDRGVLTEDEYSAQKARLLES